LWGPALLQWSGQNAEACQWLWKSLVSQSDAILRFCVFPSSVVGKNETWQVCHPSQPTPQSERVCGYCLSREILNSGDIWSATQQRVGAVILQPRDLNCDKTWTGPTSELLDCTALVDVDRKKHSIVVGRVDFKPRTSVVWKGIILHRAAASYTTSCTTLPTTTTSTVFPTFSVPRVVLWIPARGHNVEPCQWLWQVSPWDLGLERRMEGRRRQKEGFLV